MPTKAAIARTERWALYSTLLEESDTISVLAQVLTDDANLARELVRALSALPLDDRLLMVLTRLQDDLRSGVGHNVHLKLWYHANGIAKTDHVGEDRDIP